MRSRLARASAFTLIELMISIALVLALMIGVNYVFSSVGQATGLTQAVSRVTREMQGAQAIMARDFATADVQNAPFIVLRSYPQRAFRSRTDYVNAADQTNPALDYDALGGQHHAHNVSNRMHRMDILLFFGRDKFTRQTGGGTFNTEALPREPYLGDMATQEAMIWYGHLCLPDDNGAFPELAASPPRPLTNPGVGSLSVNPNNFFANQWVLGRVQIGLQAPTPEGDPTGKIITKKPRKDAAGNFLADAFTSQIFIRDPNPVTTDSFLHPLRWDSESTYPMIGGRKLDESRYDLAGTSMSLLRSKTAAYVAGWWNGLVCGPRRFKAQPFVLGGAGARLSPDAVALQSPIFISNCSQFIVEYAGDFLPQLATGQLDATNTATPPGDGVDFNFDTTTLQKSIRWYGFPRDVDGDGDIRKFDGADLATSDVVPIRDYAPGKYQFERDIHLIQQKANYLQTPAVPSSPLYTAAWGPGDSVRPSMFRILIAVDDPNGRFTDPLMFEYVFKLPGGQ